ncbi:MAG: class I SAM-dependent methyltransferase, partial [Woeseiaceae bacterium]|nr:class I SAM-dependent methyltransferase [Woeseiaceae bacterium]
MSTVTARAVGWTESGFVPDSVIRAGIRRLLERKRGEIRAGDMAHAAETVNTFVEMMNASPIALVPELANEQHYEVPAEFFSHVMGAHHKYSCCHWSDATETLTQAEADALTITADRADIDNGMRVLDMGCGWGSFSLWAATRYPDSRFTAVSNSSSQQAYIRAEAEKRGIANLDVLVCDMNDFRPDGSFDRIVSIEMFEHMRNYGELFRRISEWLSDDGRFFMHIFCHRTTPYEYLDNGPGDWMSRHFFSGGIMPSADLPLRFADHL